MFLDMTSLNFLSTLQNGVHDFWIGVDKFAFNEDVVDGVVDELIEG